MRDEITILEEVSLNAWPALQTILYDGWVLRFANGYTHRANSINPILPSSIDLDEKLEYCEKLYRDKSIDVIFKITPIVYPENLDSLLAGRGYLKNNHVSVQWMELKHAFVITDNIVNIQEEFSKQWLESFGRMNKLPGCDQLTFNQMMNNIIPKHCFASIISDNKIIACGLGILQMGYLGLFDIITDELYRMQGYGKLLIQNILNWGIKNGAHSAYLQVLIDNNPAIQLYSKLGFSESYQFWFRSK